MTIIYLIRHGETAWNAEGRFQGQRNISLNATGHAQAAATSAALSHLPFTAIYTSDLARSAETAACLATPHGLSPIPDIRLREACFGAWEGLTLTEIGARWPLLLATWQANAHTTRPPGGETLAEVQQRVAAALGDCVARHPDATIALIGHGGTVRAVVATVLGADLSIFRRLRLDNCSISIVQMSPERSVLRQLNDLCHLSHQIPQATWDEASEHELCEIPNHAAIISEI